MKISASTLASRAKVAVCTLQDIEAGRAVDVKLSTLVGIANALQMPVIELLRDDSAVFGCACGRLAEYVLERHEARETAAAIAVRLGVHESAVQFILHEQYESLRLRRH